jgi:hypothetical protein
MRNVLTLAVLSVFVLIFVARGPVISTSKFTMLQSGQTAATILMYDEYGDPMWVDEVYDGSITNNRSDVFYTYYDEPAVYYEYPSYNSYYEAYYVPYNPSDNGYYYDTWGNPTYNYYYTPPPPPPQTWYAQTFPGVGSVAQTIVQGIAPQTRTAQSLSCSISANPSVIPYGGSTLIRWVSQGSEWADLTELGIVDRSGSWQFDDFTRSKTFTLNISGLGGTATCSTIVTVQPRR